MSKPMQSSGFAISATVALGRHSPSCGRRTERLKLAYGSPWVGWGPFYVAAEKGYFKDEGLEVDIAYIEPTTPQAGFDLLTDQEVDGRFSTLDEAALYWTPAVTIRRHAGDRRVRGRRRRAGQARSQHRLDQGPEGQTRRIVADHAFPLPAQLSAARERDVRGRRHARQSVRRGGGPRSWPARSMRR